MPRVRALSSVGLEHHLDRVGVTGSNPVVLTRKNGRLCLEDILPIFYSMMEFRKSLFLILVVVCLAIVAKADIGQTHQLKQERSRTLTLIKELRVDTVDNARQIDSLQQVVISLDSQIMVSYDETVKRLAARNRDFGTDTKVIVLAALLTTTLALILFLLILIARRRIMARENAGILTVFKQLAAEFVSSVSQDQASSKSILRVNVVVVLGLIFMSISVLAFLLRTL